MQTASNENHTVSYKDASVAPTTRVRLYPTLYLYYTLNFEPDPSFFTRPKLVGVKKKLDRREAVRERKALSAAKLERSIQAELIERLKLKAYGDAPLNVNEEVWQAVLDQERKGKDKQKLDADGLELEDDETDEELEEDINEEDEAWDEEDGEEGWGDREFVSDVSESEGEDGLSDLEDVLVRIFPWSSTL